MRKPGQATGDGLALTFAVSLLTLGIRRTTILRGMVHIIIFAIFVFLAAVP